MASQFVFTFVLGFIIRLIISLSTVPEWLLGRNEIVTPLTAWKRVIEGLALHKLGISPYSGDIYHEPPLMLYFWKYVINIFGDSIYLLFIVIDVISAIVVERLVFHSGQWLLLKQEGEVKKYSPDSKNLMISKDDVRWSSTVALLCYLWNPYNIAACAAKSTALFVNLFVVFSLLFALKGAQLKACLFLALATYISLYPIMLIVPIALILVMRRQPWISLTSFESVLSYVTTAVCFAILLSALFVISFQIEGSTAWITATYGFILSVPDLNPNVGLFWYFFTEMFEHFRLFFLFVFQINAFIYVVPLTIRLSRNPLFLAQMLIALMAVFKSYPSYADFALHLALFPTWRYLLPYMRNKFLVVLMIVTCNILLPVLWHLWIYAGSANANFFFAATLTYATAQIFLMTDLLFAFLRHDYDLIHGTKPPLINGEPATIVLD